MSGETSKLSPSKGGDQKQTQSGQSRREDITYWRQSIRQQYPKLTQGTHFVPPLHFPRGDSAGSSTHRFPSFPTSTPSGSKFTKPSEKKLPDTYDTYEERMLTSSVPESGVLDGQQRFLYGLHELAERTHEVMMVLSQMKFGQYVNKPSYAAAADAFLGQSANIKDRSPGETDVLIINKQYGLITGEIRDVQMTEHEKDVSILATIQEAITKLNESEGVLKQLVSFMLDVSVTKTLILPSITSDQLSHALSKDVKTQEDLCRCLGVKTLTEALELCLLADDTAPSVSKWEARPGSITQMASWWPRVLKQTGYKVDMSSFEYEHLVAMFCGPATTVRFHVVTPPRLGFDTGTPFDSDTEYIRTKGVDSTSYSQFDTKTHKDTGKQSYIDSPFREKYFSLDTGSLTGITTGPIPAESRGQTLVYTSLTSGKTYTDTEEKPLKYTSGKTYTDTGEKPYTYTSKGKYTPVVKIPVIMPSTMISDSESDDEEFPDQTASHPEPVSSETVSHPGPVSSETDNTSDPLSGESPSIKPIFSETWQMCQTFTSSTGQMQGKDSDIVLFVPEGAIEQQDEVIVHGAVCTDLKTVHQELRLEDSETIVSPVVEYHTDHLGEFQKPVNIYLPLFIPSTTSPSESLRVYRFFKTENGSMDKEQLLYKTLEEEKTAGKNGKENEHFFYLTEHRQICVVALHFCGFVCSCGMGLKPGPLHLRLYGVHRQRRQRETIISLFVWDGRLAIQDFEKDILFGQDQELEPVTKGKIGPIEENSEEESMGCKELGARMELSEEDEEKWMHSEIKGRQKFPVDATAQLHQIFLCQSQCFSIQGASPAMCLYKREPEKISWEFQNKPNCTPDKWFSCSVLVGYVKTATKPMSFLDDPNPVILSVSGLQLKPLTDAATQTVVPDGTHQKKLADEDPLRPVVHYNVHNATQINVDRVGQLEVSNNRTIQNDIPQQLQRMLQNQAGVMQHLGNAANLSPSGSTPDQPALPVPAANMPNLSVPFSDMPNLPVPVSDMPNLSVPVSDMPNLSVPVSDMPNLPVPVSDMPNPPVAAADPQTASSRKKENRTAGAQPETNGTEPKQIR